MQDAFGGILNLVLIVLFLVIVEGILGLTVCYTKAFRMKNYIISTIEEFEGYGCFDNTVDTACRIKITEKAQKMGYAPADCVIVEDSSVGIIAGVRAAIPVIAMTADAFRENFEESLRAGMNAHIVKPLTPEKLFRTIADVMERKENSSK